MAVFLPTFAVKTKCNDDEACFKYRGVGSREAEYRQGDGDGTFEVEGQGFGMEIDLENVKVQLSIQKLKDKEELIKEAATNSGTFLLTHHFMLMNEENSFQPQTLFIETLDGFQPGEFSLAICKRWLEKENVIEKQFIPLEKFGNVFYKFHVIKFLFLK